jgi:hypothetical protein
MPVAVIRNALVSTAAACPDGSVATTTVELILGDDCGSRKVSLQTTPLGLSGSVKSKTEKVSRSSEATLLLSALTRVAMLVEGLVAGVKVRDSDITRHHILHPGAGG